MQRGQGQALYSGAQRKGGRQWPQTGKQNSSEQANTVT